MNKLLIFKCIERHRVNEWDGFCSSTEIKYRGDEIRIHSTTLKLSKDLGIDYTYDEWGKKIMFHELYTFYSKKDEKMLITC